MTVKISILAPVYNAAAYVLDMVRSVEAQQFTDYELILVNDGSTDNSLALIQAAAKQYSNIKVITYEKNKTLPGALNEGLKHCQGEYICRLDADDLLLPDCLQKQYAFLQAHPEYNAVITDELKVDGDLAPKYMLLKLLDDYYIKKQNLFRTAYGGPTILMRREVFYAAGLHDERLKSASDRALAVDAHRLSRVGHLPECLYLYREHATNITKQYAQFKKSKVFKAIIEEHTAKMFVAADYINDWEQVRRFVTLQAPFMTVRRKKYANVILKCALELAQRGMRKEALAEIRKAEFVHPQPQYKVFYGLILFGAKGALTKWYINMNVWTDYAYDDFLLYTPEF